MKESNTEKINFKFLVDKPLKEDKELDYIDFGHKELGKTLTDIVAGCNATFTIGLYGK